MSRRALVLLMVLTTGCTAALLAGADPATPQTTQWEYAVYRSWGNRYQWQTPDADIRVDGWQAFLWEVGLTGVLSERTNEAGLISHFGKQGWTLVEVSPPGEGRLAWVFWFKRPGD
ncbi:MAG: hypothetical protein ACYTAS_23105 [Planctomycetota bacterium]